MALDAGPFMRLGTRGSPSWPGFAPETGYVNADWSDQIAEALADGAGHTFSARCRAVGLHVRAVEDHLQQAGGRKRDLFEQAWPKPRRNHRFTGINRGR